MTERLRERLAAFGIRPRRRFSQSFLHDPSALNAIARAVAADRPEAVIEIGPGPGTLTDRLVELVEAPIVGVEMDLDLVRLLSAHFAHVPSVRIVAGDFLAQPLEALSPPGVHPAVVGNIPYHLSSPILLHLLEHRARIGATTLMLQKELAERIRAPVGTRASGSLTVVLALVADVERVLGVGPGAFLPPPQVASEVVKIRWRDPRVDVPSVAVFERVVRAGFGQRRKTLRNALGSLGQAEAVASAAGETGLDLGRRAETLSLEEWGALTRSLARAGVLDPQRAR